MQWNKILTQTTEPDERIRMLRWRAGAVAANIMVILALIAGSYLMFNNHDYRNGGLLIWWIILSGIYTLISDHKSSRFIREEVTRDMEGRKRALRMLFVSIPLMFAYWFCIAFFITIFGQKTLKETIFYALWMTVWMEAFFWWRYFRKYKDKKVK